MIKPRPLLIVVLAVYLEGIALGQSSENTPSAIAKSDSAQQPAANADVGWLDHWRASTFSFGMLERDNAGQEFYKAIGTGLLVATDPRTAYIVTAKHIFSDPSKHWHPDNIRIRFSWQESKSVYDEHGLLVQLRDAQGTDLWVGATDGSDIAAIPAPPISQLGPAPHAIFLNDIANAEEMFEGATLIVLGYPGIVGNEYLIRAISRAGIISWLSPTNPLGTPFLIDANIYPGNSGGPVIKIPTGLDKRGNFVVGGRVALLGLVSEAPGQNQEITLRVPGVLAPLQLTQVVPLGGTGIIVPASKIPELLKSVAARKAP